jgi:hypothetical protein
MFYERFSYHLKDLRRKLNIFPQTCSEIFAFAAILGERQGEEQEVSGRL